MTLCCRGIAASRVYREGSAAHQGGPRPRPCARQAAARGIDVAATDPHTYIQRLARHTDRRSRLEMVTGSRGDGCQARMGNEYAAPRAHHHVCDARHTPGIRHHAAGGGTHWPTRLADVFDAAIPRTPHTGGGPKAVDNRKMSGQYQPTRGDKCGNQATSAVRRRERNCSTAFV